MYHLSDKNCQTLHIYTTNMTWMYDVFNPSYCFTGGISMPWHCPKVFFHPFGNHHVRQAPKTEITNNNNYNSLAKHTVTTFQKRKYKYRPLTLEIFLFTLCRCAALPAWNTWWGPRWRWRQPPPPSAWQPGWECWCECERWQWCWPCCCAGGGSCEEGGSHCHLQLETLDRTVGPSLSCL